MKCIGDVCEKLWVVGLPVSQSFLLKPLGRRQRDDPEVFSLPFGIFSPTSPPCLRGLRGTLLCVFVDVRNFGELSFLLLIPLGGF